MAFKIQTVDNNKVRFDQGNDICRAGLIGVGVTI